MTNQVVVGQSRYRADLEKSPAVVREHGPGGDKQYRIEHVLGGKNIFYFLALLEKGRLQTLPVAYDVRRKEWFDTAASAMRHFPNVTNELVHWTEPPYTFNTACHSCHVSQMARNYDPATETYHTTWKEPGINCETCHGPSAEHVRVCVAAGDRKPEDLKIIRTRTMTPAQRNDHCSVCHAKAMILSDSFSPGARLLDHFGLVTFENPDYHPDGRDLGENYTYTSWRLSPCLESHQFECLHCHTSSGRFRQKDDPNSACLPCHDQRVKNVTAHSHHPPDSAGNRCISCHMPKTEFARMVRSDHSMLPPTPALTIAVKSPNACNVCHTNKDAAWADKLVREWHKEDYQAPVLRRASLVDAARKGDWSRLPDILAYLASPDRSEIFASSLIRLLNGCSHSSKWPSLRRAATDASPLVRAAALSELQSDLGDKATRDAVLKALSDEYRSVRLAAVSTMLGFPRQQLEPAQAAPLDQALKEYLAMLESRPDDSLSKYNLGNYHHLRGDRSAAITAYETSARLDPANILPLVNVSMLYAEAGQMDRAEQSLRRALTREPNSAPANFNLGLLVAEKGDFAEAQKLLRAAIQADPAMAAAAYNLAVIVGGDRPDEAISLCRQAVKSRPDEPKYGFTLAYYLLQKGDEKDAVSALEKVLERTPGHLDSIQMLGQLHERSGRRSEAAALYERTISRAGLPPEVQAALRARIETLRAGSAR
jgi:tetratricopeptide (TPR) repeat protein